MARGPKRHLKRVNAPKHWMLDKMGGAWAPRPSTGPHKLRECIPLILILRNRLKYALNTREVVTICQQKLVSVNGKVRTDHKFPCGFMDVISLKKSNENFRLLYDTKGRYILNPIPTANTVFKLAKVVKLYTGANKIPLLTTSDGRTIRYPDPAIKLGDTVKIELSTNKILSFLHFEIGCIVAITKGRNCGRVGTLVHREKHDGNFDIIHVKDAAGSVFATREVSAMTIGENEEKIEVALMKGKGVKMTIVEERAVWIKKQQQLQKF